MAHGTPHREEGACSHTTHTHWEAHLPTYDRRAGGLGRARRAGGRWSGLRSVGDMSKRCCRCRAGGDCTGTSVLRSFFSTAGVVSMANLVGAQS